MDWKNVIGTLVPTVASALGGPAAGVVVSAIGEIFGITGAKESDIRQAIENGQLTGEQIASLKELELKLKAEEQERGFRYAELEFKDRDSARRANVDGGTAKQLFILSLLLLGLTIGAEIYILFFGVPKDTSEIVIGRVLGLLDAVAMTIIAYWYGSSHGSFLKNEMITSGQAK